MTLQQPFFRFKPAIVLTACLILAACASDKKLPPKIAETETTQPQLQTPPAQPQAPAQPQPQAQAQAQAQMQPQPSSGSYAARPDAMAFADELASRRKLDPQWVRQAMGQSSFNPTVSRLMQPSTKTFVKNWRVYRSRFIDPIRIRAGVNFWRANRSTLARAEAE